jgi:hypothetical protein
MMPPQGFAKGGIAEAAQLVASKGRRGDTMLAHITPFEARLLKARGGSGTINPVTGLPEFFLKKLVKSVKKVVKKVVASPIGRIAVTVGLSMIGVPPGIASALVTKAAGGTWKDALKAAAVSYLASPAGPIGSYVSKATPFLSGLAETNPALVAGIRSGLTSTGASLLTGSSLKEAVTAGVTSGLMTGVRASQASAAFDRASQANAQQLSGQESGQLVASGGTGTPVTSDFAQTTTVDPVTGQVVSGGGTGTPVTSTEFTRADAQGVPTGVSTAQNPNPFISAGDLTATTTTVLPSGQVVNTPPPAPSSFLDTVKGFYDKNISPSGIREAGQLQAQQAGTAAVENLVKLNPNASDAVRAAEYARAANAAAPGVISQYGPGVGAGLGVMALAGGFERPDPEAPTRTQTALETPIEVPETLRRPIQNLPGVEYDAAGNIIGSKAWDPYAGINPNTPTSVATPGIASLPLASMYQQPVSQLYAQPSRNPTPTGFRAGGIAALAKGGYPRRIGQISGPGTETSDDIPAMLSDGEFVMTAGAVRGAGNGSRREGAKKMYALMHQLEQNAARG